MPTEMLTTRRGTRGSFAEVIYGRRLRTKAYIPLRRYSFDAAPWPAEEEDYAPPVQSSGQSQASRRIEGYLGSAIASYSGLVSNSPKQIRMTASPSTRAAAMDPWKLKNRRRIRLIEKQHRGKLTTKEAVELATLEAQCSAHLREVAPRSREVLDEFSDYIERMKAKVAAKKGIRP